MWIGESASFMNRTLSWADVLIRSSAASTWSLRPLYSRSEKSKWFPPFMLDELFCLFLERMWLLYKLRRKMSFRLILCTIKCLYHINWLVLFPNEYSVLGYSLWDNLMLYKKRSLIHKITPRYFWASLITVTKLKVPNLYKHWNGNLDQNSSFFFLFFFCKWRIFSITHPIVTIG